MQTVHQCPHYMRNCTIHTKIGQVEAPCCRIFYPCKLCHDQKFQFKKGCQNERMEFQKVQNIRCLNCQQVQPPSLTCTKCEGRFGVYACLECRLYENNPAKVDDIFHCDECKMCRRGTTETVKHCKKCGYCIPVANKNHKSQCPVCLEVLLYSTQPYINMKCGHLIHVDCQIQLKDINCPTCGMASQNLTKSQNARIEKLIEETKDKLPPELIGKKVNILCNQCLHKTIDAPFHYYGIKCGDCGTYNTKMI